MATTAIDETTTKHDEAGATEPATHESAGGAGTKALPDQATRVDELRSDLDVADERSEAARLAYVEGTQKGLDPDELRALRRAWDSARAARNSVETLVMIQDATAPASTDN